MNIGPVSIRAAMPEDAPTLVAAEKAIAEIPGRLASSPEELTEDHVREKIIALQPPLSGIYLVIEQNGHLLGHAFLEPHKLKAAAHVVFLTIAIHEGYQGQGLGRKLMKQLIAWAKAQAHIEKIELQVRSANARAIHLYESLGFVEEGRKTKRLKYGPNTYLDDVYMALWVGNA